MQSLLLHNHARSDFTVNGAYNDHSNPTHHRAARATRAACRRWACIDQPKSTAPRNNYSRPSRTGYGWCGLTTCGGIRRTRAGARKPRRESSRPWACGQACRSWPVMATLRYMDSVMRRGWPSGGLRLSGRWRRWVLRCEAIQDDPAAGAAGLRAAVLLATVFLVATGA